MLRLGVILLLEGKIADAKQKLSTSKRIYELAEDLEGWSYCESILAECETEGRKVCLKVFTDSEST